jgi:hypothetical protein
MRIRPVLNVTLEPEIDSAVRARATTQRRPLSWVVSDLLRIGLAHRVGKVSRAASVSRKGA